MEVIWAAIVTPCSREPTSNDAWAVDDGDSHGTIVGIFT